MADIKEWTLMFYFASDNPLAISIVSQLKAIKAAGFHPEANVIAQFDPYTEGTPTHIFDVNLVNKLKSHGTPNIGFLGNDAFVRNMIEDKLWRDQKTRTIDGPNGQPIEGELIRKELQKVLRAKHRIDYKPPVAPNGHNGFEPDGDEMFHEPDPETSLRTFLSFCSEKYPARHYMLFILGHGVVVGNDVFMFDEHATTKNSLTLTELGDVLNDFKNDIELEGASFELISFHSCSVSSLEVAYELEGTANFMLASQGPAFVGSWPYRQILIHIFNDLVEQGGQIDVREMLVNIFQFCLFNSADFLLAGYSFQLTLCDLTKIAELKGPVERLSAALLNGLDDLLSRDSILLSHWKSQSFFNEMYTDLYDFCFCFFNKVRELRENNIALTRPLIDINDACMEVMARLVKENPKRERDPEIPQVIVAADSIGPAYQYSRGLSVYFPWSEPSRDAGIMAQYAKYKFTTDFQQTSWLDFLTAYFSKTMRAVSKREADNRRFLPLLTNEETLDEDIASLVYNSEGSLSFDSALASPKSDPNDRTGGEYDGVSIKNYPRDIRARGERRRQADQRFPLSESFGLLQQVSSNGN